MGVSSISIQDVHATVPASARTPYVSEKTPIEARPEKLKTDITEPAERSESAMANTNSIRLRVDKATNRIIAQVVDENNEVVRQIPPEEMLRIAENTRQLLGLLFDETV